MEKTNANIGFEKQLLDVANALWGHISQTDYRNVIIGLIFSFGDTLINIGIFMFFQ